MNNLKIGLLQIEPSGSLEGNMIKGMDFCRSAKEKGADIALFPKMYSCGYDIYSRPANVWENDAVSIDSEFVKSFARLAAEIDMAIGITFLEECKTGPKNTLVLFDRFGNNVLTYSKVHTCDFGAERALTPGDNFFVTDLNTVSGTVRVGDIIWDL